ncbi:related to WD40-repeat protein (notchless protein) [Phialocephala subalpina]|uniref:Related to WD40-repeat protein (Notchless protein) n=1 Tax=Phialocephala subalpina TaxID=576137 RepID=A0A1L7WIF0_9HELO|nr:related to WD40-repeat protein (notchless protein) [Phialocephala subalpina]
MTSRVPTLSAPASTWHLSPNLHLTSHLCQLGGSITTKNPSSYDSRTWSKMRLLQYNNDSEFSLTEFFEGDIPEKYAILSHRWGAEEVTFKDLTDGTSKGKAGYGKIQFCGEQARRDDLQYFWVDTCCIDKSNAVELQEAINSMFRWYRDATKCYVYLPDVSRPRTDSVDGSNEDWGPAFRKSVWFSRGWTLQELIAPASVDFFCKEGELLGNKASLERHICEVTGIPASALRRSPLSDFSVAERLSWAASRETFRQEDKAYSLLGIFDVNMPLIYGEGYDKALKRLRKEIDEPLKELDCLPFATDAQFNSFDRQDKLICLPDTRVDLLQEIYDWADGQDERCIFWLNGMAGTGKSTIARTVARKYFDEERLGASFFFSRGGGDVSHAGKFFTSIAVQLADNIPSLRHYICDAVIKRKEIASQSFRDQWSQLILGPLLKLGNSSSLSSYVLVVDALDECDKEEHIRMILQLLAEARTLKMVQLRIFLTSRPETPIRHGIHRIPQAEHQDFILQDIPRAIVDHDIWLFLEYNLGMIGQEWTLGADWPSKAVLKQLVLHASGLFIWASTVCRFIHKGKRQLARTRLDTILKGSSRTVTEPENHLNEIYLAVLNHSISEYSDEEKEGTLKKDICEMHAPDSHASQVESSWIEKCLPPEVQYACLYWVQHLRRSSSQVHDGEEAHQFLQAHLLHWLETLGWMGKTSEGIQAILSLEAHISAIESPNLHAFIHDTKRFTLYNRLVIERVPLQLYCSALVFAPEKSIARKTFEKCIPSWIQKRPKVQERWDALQQTLEGHSSSVTSVAFSPNGKQVVSSSGDNTIRLWDAATGAALQTLEGHSSWISSVAFSPNGKQVVSGSRDSTIRLWDTATGAALQTLEGHSSSISSVAFSPNGKQVVSGSWDNTIRLWDTATGAALQTLEGHSSWISSVAFSPNGKQVVSGSRDNTIRLWDAATRAALQTLEGHSDWISLVAFSPDGKQVVSGSWDNTIRLWDTATGAALQVLKGHSSSITLIAFSPDGKQVVSSSYDNTIRLWDTATGAALQTLEGHSSSISSVVFSPNGKLQTLSALYNWVIEDGVKIIWLPPIYRATSLAMYNNSIVLGHSSGRLSILGFKEGLKFI